MSLNIKVLGKQILHCCAATFSNTFGEITTNKIIHLSARNLKQKEKQFVSMLGPLLLYSFCSVSDWLVWLCFMAYQPLQVI